MAEAALQQPTGLLGMFGLVGKSSGAELGSEAQAEKTMTLPFNDTAREIQDLVNNAFKVGARAFACLRMHAPPGTPRRHDDDDGGCGASPPPPPHAMPLGACHSSMPCQLLWHAVRFKEAQQHPCACNVCRLLDRLTRMRLWG